MTTPPRRLRTPRSGSLPGSTAAVAAVLTVALGLLLTGRDAMAAADAGRCGVIVFAPRLREAAEAWRAYRQAQGWEILLLPTDAAATPESLRASIRDQLLERPPAQGEQRAILLLGDVGPEGVPTFTFEQPEPAIREIDDSRFASDHPYALLRGEEERSAIAVGRIPVSTDAEARAALAKLRRYEEHAPPGEWRRRVQCVASEGHFAQWDALLESLFIRFIDEFIPDGIDIGMTYAKVDSPWCPPPSSLESTVLARLTDGSLIFDYVGHGSNGGLDSLHWGTKRLPMLRAESLGRLPDNGGRAPIALLCCCSTGRFDLPAGGDGHARDCLAESLFKAEQGPVAVIAGTAPTHPYGNMVVEKEFMRTLLGHTDLTIGEVDRLARRAVLDVDAKDRQLDAIVRPVAAITKWKLSLDELRLMHVRMYALIGDPMMRIAAPGRAIADLRLDGTTLRGSVPAMRIESVEVTIESDRRGHGRHALTPSAPNDDVEARTAHNYPLANDRALWHHTAAHHASTPDGTGDQSGAFAVELPSPLPADARIVRVVLLGRDERGVAIEAFGGLRVPGPSAPLPPLPEPLAK